MALTDKLTNIADAIRTQTDTTDKMTLDEMPEKISKLGDINGYFLESISETYPTVADFILKLPKLTFVTKKSTEATEMRQLRSLFSGYVNLKAVPEIELINYDYDYLSLAYMFQGARSVTDITNLITLLDKYKICDASYMLANCESLSAEKINEILKHITLIYKPEITANSLKLEYFIVNNQNITELNIPFDTSEVTSIRYMISDCRNLTTVSAFDCSNVMDIQSPFASCFNIENIGGFINFGKNLTYKTDFYLNLPSKVTHESLINILNGLYDISNTEANGSSLSLGSGMLGKLSDEEKAIATNKGWNIR